MSQQMTREASEVLAKAMQLSARERGFLIDQLIESLDEGPDEPGVWHVAQGKWDMASDFIFLSE